MKATGVVRRIDDLGRIVIPKELRRTMRIKEGDSLEIFIDGSDKVILRKYSPVQNIHDIVEEFVSGIYESNKVDIIVTDSDKIIAVGGSLPKELIGKKVTMSLEDRMHNRTTQIIERGSNFMVTDSFSLNKAAVFKPIHVYGDILGSIIIVGDNGITDVEKSLIEFSSSFFNKYLEN